VIALRLVCALTALLPWRTLGVPGRLLGWLCGSVLRVRRRAVEDAMRRAGIAEPRREARAMYNNLGRSLFEILWLAGAGRGRRREALAQSALDCATERALLDAALRGPVVIAASHTGSWEVASFVAASALRRTGRSLTVVVKPLSVGPFNVFCMQLRESFGLRIVAPEGALAAAIHALSAGDVVVMLIDQVPDCARHGCEVPFLGASAFADRAPAVLAQATGATLLVVAAERRGAGQHIRILAEIDACNVHGMTRADRASAATKEATATLERFCLSSPENWLWLHRRWRCPPEDINLSRRA